MPPLRTEENMAQTELIVQMDDDLKAEAEALFRNLGMNFSTAFSAFVRQSLKQGRIPFDVDEPEPPGFAYSRELEEQDSYFDRREQAELHRAIAEIEAGESVRFDPLRETTATARARLNG
jgi:addiction module RelB/DinJ family antitoxin